MFGYVSSFPQFRTRIPAAVLSRTAHPEGLRARFQGEFRKRSRLLMQFVGLSNSVAQGCLVDRPATVQRCREKP